MDRAGESDRFLGLPFTGRALRWEIVGQIEGIPEILRATFITFSQCPC